jgi:hypothetical protein
VTGLETYVNKTVEFKFNGAALRFDLSHALFSSFDIDVGTRLLLKTAARDPVLASARRILDEGCGVGVIGLCAAKAFPEAEVLLRDRDSLAVAFAERNRLLNRLRGISAWKDPASGEERLPRPAPRAERGLLGDGSENGSPEDSRGFDFVFSNLPAKAGAPVLARFFDRLSGKAGFPLLVPGGRAAVVVVNPLAEAASEWISASGLGLIDTARGGMHRVYVVERVAGDAGKAAAAPPEAAPDAPGLGPYIRAESRFKLGDLAYRAFGFWGLPEFDTPSYGSSAAAELAAKAMGGRGAARDALFLEPGAGHLALWAARELGVRRLTAASRDELALRAAGRNLATLPERFRPEYSAIDALSASDLPPASFDLIAESPDVVPERDWIGPAWSLAGSLLRPGGVYLAFCSPTDMSRLEKRRPSGAHETPSGGSSPVWTLLGQKRKKGYVASAWRRG